jgi:S-DNA-T family DNA segregation ATPase FtsK/SpoIIIE
MRDFPTSKVLESALDAFKVKGKVENQVHGPVIDVFDVRLSVGTRFKRIENLADDIARSIMARSCRITQEAASGLVRIEATRAKADTVPLSQVFQNVAAWSTAALPVGLGVDVAGAPVVIDLTKAPHLLIAGTTGSGKSMLLNAIILSLISHRSPADVRMILCDPKRIELTRFNGLPHLLAGCPVLTDADLIVDMLQRALWEMEERNERMSKIGAQNIEEYNNIRRSDQAPPAVYFPRLVIVIDELASLMAVAKDAVEDRLSRLAAMGRSAGIHIVVATQRPSREVITGVIKANFPSRVCLRVASKVDSRVVLDQNGGEVLLGNGDMLYQAAAAPAPVRVHGAIVPTETIVTAMRRFT